MLNTHVEASHRVDLRRRSRRETAGRKRHKQRTEVVHSRLKGRGADPDKQKWEYRRASECCLAHVSDNFATHLNAVDRTPEELTEHLLICTRGKLDKDTT